MKQIISTILNFVFISIFLTLSTNESYAQKNGYELVWHDEFDGTELDGTKWRHRGLGARRGGTVVEEATSLDGNGNLMITTNILDSTHYYVGMIGTAETYNTTYGYFEARAKFGKRLSWDSFWLQCPTAYQAGPPLETGAEIDIYEYTGGVSRMMTGWDDNGDVIYDTLGYQVNHNVYWGDDDGVLKSWGSHSSVVNDVTNYVTVAVEWTETRYLFYVNDVLTFTTNKGVSGIDEYIILSVEPYYWDDLPDSILNGATVQDTFFVDYVRVYQKIATDIEGNDTEIPNSLVLNQNYPNPFNPSTTINYSIPFVERHLSRSDGSELESALQVTLKVYDILGNKVATLVNEEQQAGSYEVKFDASNLTSGMYLYKIQAGEFSDAKKMLLLK